MSSYPELKGKKAIVTGGSAGIGKSVVQCLAEEGVDVAVVDIKKDETVEKMIRELGTKSFFVSCDVRRPEQVEAACSEIMRKHGKVDILVNCAGGYTKGGNVTEFNVDDWDDIVDLNLRSVFLFTRLVLPGMMEQKWGRIVSIASMSAHDVPVFTTAIYSSAKAGILGFTKHVAKEVAGFGVTVNAVSPGITLSERVKSMLTPERIAERSKMIPAGRLSQPVDQAWGVVFLCSEKASYITGATLNISGGLVLGAV